MQLGVRSYEVIRVPLVLFDTTVTGDKLSSGNKGFKREILNAVLVYTSLSKCLKPLSFATLHAASHQKGRETPPLSQQST